MSALQDNLATYYDYWDKYIRDWAYRKDDPDKKYIPEPWWGWTLKDNKDGKQEELHCVVINLNPGQGGKLQTKRCMNCMLGCVAATDYSKSMDLLREHLEPTERWHHKRRYTPIMNALGVNDNIPTDTRHYLGIELLPNHQIKNFSEEVEKKALEIFDYVLSFAAEASMNITSPNPIKTGISLRDTVIMRGAPKYLDSIIAKLNEAGHRFKDKIEKMEINNRDEKSSSPSFYHFKGLSRPVLIICITGARNNLPKSELDAALEILKSIKNKPLN